MGAQYGKGWNFFYVFYQIILLVAIMLKVSDQRQYCSSVRTKRSQSAPLQQSQNEGKQFRTLLSIVSQNINSTVRLHRACLGDVDILPRIKASREEHQSVVEQLDKIYAKMEDKVIKDAINRNVSIKRSINEYLQSYNNAFPGQKTNQNNENAEIETADQDFTSKELLTERRQPTLHTTPKRPQSSKETRSNKMSLINQAYQTFQSSQPYKIKTVSAFAKANPQSKDTKDNWASTPVKLSRIPSRGKKTLLNNKNRYNDAQSNKQRQYDQFLFNGDQIMINQRKIKDYPSQSDLQSQNSPYTRRHSTKRMLNLKLSQRKSINDVQKMQIQNRIMMINTVLSVNLVQPQGYRPKSRCWQNYFN